MPFQQKSKAPFHILLPCLIVLAGVVLSCDSSRTQNTDGAPSVQTQNADAAPSAQAQNGEAQGVDVSHYQGKVNWELVKQGGTSFGFAKATGGITTTDSEFANNWNGMREAGVVRGAYHFFYAADDATDQANHFIQTVQAQTLKSDDLPPVLDIEITDGVSGTELVEGVKTWLEAVEKAFGRKPIIYTDPSFANEYLTDPAFGDYPLWIADYGVQTPSIPQAWQGKAWSFWQYSQSGTVNGIEGAADLDRFNGSYQEMLDFIKDTEDR